MACVENLESMVFENGIISGYVVGVETGIISGYVVGVETGIISGYANRISTTFWYQKELEPPL